MEELEASGGALSSQVNSALRSELAAQRRRRLLSQLLDELEADIGPPDEEAVLRYMDWLS